MIAPSGPAPRGAPVGVLGAGAAGWVDGAGSVQVGDVELQWWIGSADRWHRPAQEVAVRQELLDGAPVVQTALRIPGGDARARTYGVVHEGAPWLVLEVHNDSRTPVAVAVVARSTGAAARWEPDGPALRRDGSLLTLAARAPDALAGGADLEALASELARRSAEPADAPVGGAGQASQQAAVLAQVFAVAHTTGMRLLINADPSAAEPSASRSMSTPASTSTATPASRSTATSVEARVHGAPAAEAVIRGWRRQLDACSRLGLGDEGAEQLVFERRSRLLLSPAATPADISALAGLGHHEQAAARLDAALSALRAPVAPADAAALLVAAADVVAWCADADDATQLTSLLGPVLVELAGWCGRGPEAQALAQWALQRARVDGRAPARAVGPDPAGAALHEVRSRQLAGQGDGAALLAVRRQLVVDDDPSTLALLEGWRADWRGRSLDLHHLPTTAGPLSLALRWHGRRPALLWQLDPKQRDLTPHAQPPRLLCPVLDPAFETTAAEGEVLLAEPPTG